MTMTFARLGDIIYWFTCLFAAIIVCAFIHSLFVDYVLASSSSFDLRAFALAAGAWLFGRAARFILAGR
jgi:hypothetical protein